MIKTQIDPNTQTNTLTLPSLNPIPDDMTEIIRELLDTPPTQALEDWLLELTKSSGHLSTGDSMRWRVLCLVWLVTCFNTEKAWPYLMWLNMNQETLSDHLNEILDEAINEMNCHIQLANWIEKAKDKRIKPFFAAYKHIPSYNYIENAITHIFITDQGKKQETGVWLRFFCQGTDDSSLAYLRPWHLLGAAWYASCFDHESGLAMLKKISDNAETLPAEETKTLTKLLNRLNGLAPMMAWIGDCPNPAVKTMLKEVGHPNLKTWVEDTLQSIPNYSHLNNDAAADFEQFTQLSTLLEKAGITPTGTHLLDLGCGPLASQTLLFNVKGYKTSGVDLDIPPAYLPLSGFMQRFKRGKHNKVWQEATQDYYQALSQHAGLALKWRKIDIQLADLTRLPFENNSFDAIICPNYLHLAPDVNSLLAEAARVLKAGGVFIANIKAYPALNGAFAPADIPPWAHLPQNTSVQFVPPYLPLNRWREQQYQTTLEKYFTIQEWLPEQDPTAEAQLSSDLEAILSDYSKAELTRAQVTVVALKNAP